MAALVLSLALPACAPRMRPAGPAVTPPAITGDAFIAADGMRLALRRWLPEGDPVAVILALHGFNDYSNAFAEPGGAWRARGVATYAYDQRGFGESPHAGLWPGTQTLVADLGTLSGLVRARHPGVPFFLLGESMGGAVVMAALAGPEPLPADGAVLVAPAVWGRPTMGVFKRFALWVSAHTMPWLTLGGRSLDIKPSDNIAMLKALGRDPLVIKETRVDAIWGIVNLMDAALAAAPSLGTPVLILYGKQDEVIPGQPTRRMVESLPPAPPDMRRIAIYDDGYHMLTRDLQAGKVLSDIAFWIESRAGGLPGAPLPSGADAEGIEALGGD
jgi:alpha-beta hydrolase superfamily lysophospholipase